MAERDEGGRFLAGGLSPNPGGRPRMPEAVKAKIQDLTVPAVEVLARCLSSDDERIRLAAAQQILDRAYGRPAQSTELKVEGLDAAAEHLSVLLELAERRRQQQIEGQAVLISEIRLRQ